MTALNKRISNEIDLKLKALALEVYQLQMDKMPELKNNQSEVHFQKSVRDTEYTLLYFSNALSVSSPLLFLNYIKWFSSIMINMSMSLKYLKMSVLCIEEVLSRYFDVEAYEMIHEYIEEAVLNFDRDKNEAKIEPTITPLTKYRNQYIENILNGKRDLANQMILELVESKHSIEDIYLEIFHESLHEIGRLWQDRKSVV